MSMLRSFLAGTGGERQQSKGISPELEKQRKVTGWNSIEARARARATARAREAEEGHGLDSV
jgi:hypothetical protein